MQIDGGLAVSLDRIGETQMWSTRFDATKVSMRPQDLSKCDWLGGNTDQDVITITVNQSGSFPQVKRPFGPEGLCRLLYRKGLLALTPQNLGCLIRSARAETLRQKVAKASLTTRTSRSPV